MFQPILPINLEPLLEINVRSRLIAAIGTELGNYAAGIQACYLVRNPDTDPPKNYRTTGLECLIFVPTPQTASPLHHNATLTTLWDIRLIQRDRNKSCLKAYQNILSEYPDCYLSSYFRANRDLDEQMNLSIAQAEIIK